MLTRRSFLLLPAVIPVANARGWWRRDASDLHHFSFEHVVGTSLDLDLWSDSTMAAERAAEVLLDEVERLTAVLSTRDPRSEISRLEASPGLQPSPDLAAILAAYEDWEIRTQGAVSIRPRGAGTPRNVDALGKAYILDRAAAVAADCPGVEGVLLNIGGDIVVRGRAADIAITDPTAWQDNAAPLTSVRLRDQAIATSGGYARGAHLIDARTGHTVRCASAASVIAPTALEANALATMLCVSSAEESMPLVERAHGAEAIRIGTDGHILRSAGFAAFERPRIVRAAAVANWPSGYELNVALTLTPGTAGQGGFGGFGGGGFGRGGRGRGPRRPYVAVWIENTSGRLVRVLAFWADKPRYYEELSSFYTIVGRDERRLSTLARATRAAGSYHVVWDGLDEHQSPVPAGSYRVVVETNQEHGTYAKQSGVIVCADKPAHVALSATANFESVGIDFGPRPAQA
jgi:thiamine biosynthesis lipoprotein ApbE